MQFQGAPEQLLSSVTGVRVLRVLVSSPPCELSGREIALRARAPLPRVIERLHELAAQGVVTWRVAGRAHLWRLRPTHHLVAPLAALFEADRCARSDLRKELETWVSARPGVLEARLFGSVGRGDDDARSDVDLFLLVRNRRDKAAATNALPRLREAIRDRFGSNVHLVARTQREASASPPPAFLAAARAEGIALAVGRPRAARQ